MLLGNKATLFQGEPKKKNGGIGGTEYFLDLLFSFSFCKRFIACAKLLGFPLGFLTSHSK